MILRKLWALSFVLVLAMVLAAAVGACSATGNTSPFSSNGTGGGAGTGGRSASGGSTGSVDFGPDGGDAGQGGGKPGVCDPTSCQAGSGTCMNGTCVLAENPGAVPSGTQASLVAGGKADPSFAFLYPYDQTVFPRGLAAPTMQFAGTPPDAAYVHISFSGLEYKGFYGPSNPGRIVLSNAAWKAIGLASTGGKNAVQVQVTKITGGTVTGPITETWTIATGNIRGTIYYETYGSAILGGALSVGIMQIQPGASAPTIVKNGCGNVCHTASADGSTLVAATSLLASASYDLKNNVSTINALSGDGFTYGGIYPDGSFVISASNYRTWLSNPSRLYDTQTGTNIATPSWDGVITNAGTPAFSPDGTKVVFNHEDLDSSGAGHTLAVMDYDPTQKAFSNLVDLANDPTYTLGWPAFTPDTKWVVYHAGSNTAFETDEGAVGDLYFADVATHKVARLDAADGYAGSKVYLPDNDAHLSFAPTVLPEAVGGYFWVVFTSHRSYGNLLPSMDNDDQNGKLWVAAFDLNPTPGQDPSHPAFFLDGQETGADNLRGFWVLNPCSANGDDCASGDDCCGGFCRAVDGGPLQCVPPPGGCSNEFEACKTAADCCDADFQCINSHCAQPTPT
jgi:WD40-like Beta Propeller Repeat